MPWDKSAEAGGDKSHMTTVRMFIINRNAMESRWAVLSEMVLRINMCIWKFTLFHYLLWKINWRGVNNGGWDKTSGSGEGGEENRRNVRDGECGGQLDVGDKMQEGCPLTWQRGWLCRSWGTLGKTVCEKQNYAFYLEHGEFEMPLEQEGSSPFGSGS